LFILWHSLLDNDDRMMLKLQEPKILSQELNLLQVTPVEANRLKLHNIFLTPVYVTPQRANAMQQGLCFEAHLATDQHESIWALQGVALVLNNDT